MSLHIWPANKTLKQAIALVRLAQALK